jgi:hypothetical protein
MSLELEALEYAHAGLAIFPVHPRTKAPYTSQLAATTETSQIQAWWRQHPDALIGHRLPPDVICLDIDPRHNGNQTWAAVKAECEIPTTRVHFSGRGDGGGHVWFARELEQQLSMVGLDAWAEERGVGQRVGNRWVSGIDLLRHEHRYTILPPSPHPDTGQPYWWDDDRGPEVPPAILPPFLAELLAAPDKPPERHQDGPEWRQADSIADWYTDTQTWADVLTPAGWTLVHGDGDSDGSGWRHPAATNDISATVRHRLLFVYSPNTPLRPTEPGNPDGYTRFRAFAELHHDGDQAEAARAARRLKGPEPPSALTNLANVTAKEEASRFLPGGAVLDQPERVPAVWGDGTQVLWSEGEPLLIVAPPGVGKTTLAGQLVKGLLGLGDGAVLGLAVTPRSKVLYIAGDRPQQIMRSLRRQFDADDRATLDERLVVWRGPPPADFSRQPETLVAMCHEVGADVVVLDSLKDMAAALTDDQMGNALNRALQLAVTDGIDVMALHHQRKGINGDKPNTLEDVYGSTWITAGMGSVVLLWGTAGDLVVELVHLKQPAEEVGPLIIEHDHTAGVSSRLDGFDPLAYLHGRGERGGTAKETAQAWHSKSNPSHNEIAKARRRLDALVTKGLAVVTSGTLGDTRTRTYRAVDLARQLARTNSVSREMEIFPSSEVARTESGNLARKLARSNGAAREIDETPAQGGSLVARQVAGSRPPPW